MGRVSAFLGMVLYMYPEKNGWHNRPFIDLRTEELLLNWKLCMEGKDVVWIDPIR